jgi:hypothetical protein
MGFLNPMGFFIPWDFKSQGIFKSHGIYYPMGIFIPWDFFPMGFFSFVSRISFLMRKTTIKEIIIIILNNKLNNINNMNIFKMSYN